MKARTAAAAAALMAPLFAATLAAQTPATLKFTELGHGPTVVFVHGLGGARMQWMPTVRKLITDHHVVLVDLPGHGETPMAEPFSFGACAAALDQVLAKQQGDSTVVVGHGLGGAIALIEAGAHPGRMKGLIVIDATLKPPMAVPDQQKNAFLAMMDANFDMFLRKVYMGMGRDSAEGVALYSRAALVPQPQMKAYFHALFDLDASRATRNLKTPLLFVGSSRAWADTVSWASVGKQRGFDNPGAIRARRVANSGAQMYADQPDTLANIIRQFETAPLASN
jgi:pimeloyl-ACP methyl ester carboxylesterase